MHKDALSVIVTENIKIVAYKTEKKLLESRKLLCEIIIEMYKNLTEVFISKLRRFQINKFATALKLKNVLIFNWTD